MRYSPRKVMASVIVASAVAHAIAITPDSIRYPTGKVSEFGSALVDRYEKYRIRKDREELVEEARVALKEGRLELGAFVLRGNDLDARERGEKPDLAGAQSRYDELLDSLFRAIYEGKQPYESIPDILRGMDYFGIPGGTVIDALAQNGGSCEQYAPLIASLLYDANYRNESFMRTYGANSDGVGHVAPIYRHEGKEYDLMAGGYSDLKGTLFQAEEIVEAYARAHGLAAPTLTPTSAGPASNLEVTADAAGFEFAKTLPEGKPSGLAFPSGKDAFEGSVPLFAKDAIKAFNPSGGPPGESHSSPGESSGSAPPGNIAGSEGREGNTTSLFENDSDAPPKSESFCNPYSLAGLAGSTNSALIRVHVVFAQPPKLLEDLSARIEIERKGMLGKQGWNRVIAMGKLAGLYSETYWHSKLAGKDALADAALRQRDKTVEDAAHLLAGLEPYTHDANLAAAPRHLDPRYSSLWWPLAYLGQNGDDTFFRLMENHRDSLSFLNLAYFIAKEPSRERALGVAGRLTIGQQAALFPELMGAEIEGPQEMLRAYKIYNHVKGFFSPENSSATGNSSAGKPEMPGHIVTLMKGQSAPLIGTTSTPLTGTTVRFEGISRDSVIIALTYDRSIIKKEKIRQGETKEFGFDFGGIYLSGGHVFQIKVLNLEPGNSEDDAKVRLEMTMGAAQVPNKNEKLIARGVMNAGEALMLGDYMFRFENFDKETNLVDIQVLLRQRNGKKPATIEKLKIRDGETVQSGITYPKKGEEGKPVPEIGGVSLRLDGLRKGTSYHDTKIDLALLMGEVPSPGYARGDAFADLKTMVERECDGENLGEGWKLALINACSMSQEMEGLTEKDEGFSTAFQLWLVSTRERRKAFGISTKAGLDPVQDELYIQDLWLRTH